jgi:hypothetical protein
MKLTIFRTVKLPKKDVEYLVQTTVIYTDIPADEICQEFQAGLRDAIVKYCKEKQMGVQLEEHVGLSKDNK